jgi:ferredoxin
MASESARGGDKKKAKHKRRKRLRAWMRPADPDRRRFVLGGLIAFLGGVVGLVGISRRPALPTAKGTRTLGSLPIRPPGARPDERDFLAACVRCGLCGSECDVGCIRFFGLEAGEHAMTPYIDVRMRACTLCMRCTNVCPSGALTPIDLEVRQKPKEIVEKVAMGTAVVDPELCISYLGRACGYCHDACPLPGTAIKLLPPAKPVVFSDGCVGCGRCVEDCPAHPTAIDIVREAQRSAGRLA